LPYAALLYFPTRRSSDLTPGFGDRRWSGAAGGSGASGVRRAIAGSSSGPCNAIDGCNSIRPAAIESESLQFYSSRSNRIATVDRSEEHTSELQSLRQLVC